MEYFRHKNTQFSDKEEKKKETPGWCRGGFASLSTSSPLAPLVVALESFHHKQLAEILRRELLHVLAVIVDLPCRRGTTRMQHGSKKNPRHTNAHRQRWGGETGDGTEKNNTKLVESELK